MSRYSNASDTELAKKVIELDTDAIAEVYSRYHLHLYGFALSLLNDGQLAKDVVQDVFLRILKNGMKDFDPGLSMKAYLIGGVKYKILDYFKASNRREYYYELYTRFIENGDNTKMEPLRLEEINNMVDKQIANLPNELRKVFILSWKQQKDAREIAAILDKPLHTVNTQLRDARKKIRPALLRWLRVNLWYWSWLFLTEMDIERTKNIFPETNAGISSMNERKAHGTFFRTRE
jgi:RNA polymerase sigma-70 factor (ECF subfamily)